MSRPLTAREAAEHLDMSPEAFRKAVQRSQQLQDGRVPLDGRTYLYPVAVLDDWRRERRRVGTP